MSENLDQLLARFPDNDTGDIEPEDVRVFVESTELKYDNWVVVKPSQPNGNKFPDPVAGEITLEENTAYIINGKVNVFGTILSSFTNTLIAISQDPSIDSIALDGSQGAVPLFGDYAGATSVKVLGCGLFDETVSGRIFGITNAQAIVVQNSQIAAVNLGDIAAGTASPTLVFKDVIFAANDTPIDFGGTWDTMTFDGCTTTPPPLFQTTGDTIDLTGCTFNALGIIGCRGQANVAGKFFFTTTGDPNGDQASVHLNRRDVGRIGGFITGVDNTALNWTFSDNINIEVENESVEQVFALISSDDASIWRAGQTTEGLINQTGVLEDYFGTPLVFTAPRNRFYCIHPIFTWSLNTTNADITFQLEVAGDMGFNEVFTLSQQEPTDSGGGGINLDTISGGVIGGQVNTGTNQLYSINIPVWLELVAGETYTVTLRWSQNSGGSTSAAIYRGQLMAREELTNPV